MNLEGKSAIVTGSGRGIGREIALLLGKEGAKVVVNDPGVGRGGDGHDQSPADEVVAEINDAGGTAVANYDSVADYASAGRMVHQAMASFGKLDALVNVAGMLRERMIWNMTEDDFDQVILVPQGPLEYAPSRVQGNAHCAVRAHRQLLFGRVQRCGRAVQLCRGKGGHHRTYPFHCPRVRASWNHRQRDVSDGGNSNDGRR